MDNIIESYNLAGIYGLIIALYTEDPSQENSRIKAYNLLKAGLQIAKKSKSESLSLLPTIALELSTHESIYRMAALLSLQFGNTDKALTYLTYLHHYYNGKELEPHEQYHQIRQSLIDHDLTDDEINNVIESTKEEYKHQKMHNDVKEYYETLPTSDVTEQKTYFRRIYRKYGFETVLVAVESNIRFNDREKAILLIRASRAIGAIADEGPSIESKFADKALNLDTSNTVVKNAFQAYLRAGDINKITQLKEAYADVLES